MDAEFRDGGYLLSLDPLELKVILNVLLLFPDEVTAEAFEDLVGITKQDSEKLRFQLDLRTRLAKRTAILRDLEGSGRISGLLTEMIPDSTGASHQELRKALRNSADAHVAAIESGTVEQEVLTEEVLRQVIQVISDAPEGRSVLRESVEAGSLAERFATAGHWGDLDRTTALRILRSFSLDHSRPLLSRSARMTAALLRPDST
jgi:hypothetical protein